MPITVTNAGASVSVQGRPAPAPTLAPSGSQAAAQSGGNAALSQSQAALVGAVAAWQLGGQGETSVHTAGVTLSGHMAVAPRADGLVYPADSANPADAARVIGVTTGAAQAGASVTVQEAGELSEPSWSWTPGQPIYVGPGGSLTQTPPSAGFVQQAAVAVSATAILVRVEPSTILAP